MYPEFSCEFKKIFFLIVGSIEQTSSHCRQISCSGEKFNFLQDNVVQASQSASQNLYWGESQAIVYVMFSVIYMYDPFCISGYLLCIDHFFFFHSALWIFFLSIGQWLPVAKGKNHFLKLQYEREDIPTTISLKLR